jgi:copper transport protein
LVAATLAISVRGHAGTSGHAWAVGADALHLVGVALWVGMLTHLVLVVRSTAAEASRTAMAVAVRRYSALALPTVLVILAAGGVDSLAELTAPGDLVNTGYGRTLLVKGSVVALALGLALGSRLLALDNNPIVRFGVLRRLTRAEVAALLAVLVAAGVLVNAAPPRSSAQTEGPPLALGPPPMQGPTVQLAALAGLGTVVGVIAAPDELRFRVLRLEDPAPSGTRLIVDATGNGRPADLFPRPCGPGCFEIHYRLRPGTTRLVARVAIPDWPSGAAEFDVPWPPQPAQPELLARIVRSMRAVRTMVLVEHVSSGPRANARPTIYRGDGLGFIAGEPWSAGAVDVRPLDLQLPYRDLAFALPGSDIWVRVTIDARDRLRSETLVTPGHLINRTFTYP